MKWHHEENANKLKRVLKEIVPSGRFYYNVFEFSMFVELKN